MSNIKLSAKRRQRVGKFKNHANTFATRKGVIGRRDIRCSVPKGADRRRERAAAAPAPQPGPIRTEGGKVAGSWPRICSAACMATI
jgi:hypothetical protein